MSLSFDILDKTVCLLGKRGSGKSQLLHYIIEQNRHLFKKIFLISPTESIKSFYADLIPKSNIFTEYSEEWIQKLIDRMSELSAGKSSDEADHVLLVLDDVTSDANLQQSPTMKILFQRGRHFFISVILTAQYMQGDTGIGPGCRNNLDYLLVNKINGQSLDLLVREFKLGLMSKEDFIEMYKNSTGNYNWLLVNNTSSSREDDLNSIYGTIRVPDDKVK